jgi:drug/metabolite transporter (DMT)-like permease
MPEKLKSKILPSILLVILAIIWGSSFILMKRGMETNDGQEIFSDSQVASLRMLIAAIVLLPFTILSIRKIKSIKQILFLSLVGFFGNFFPAFLFTYAETELSSGYAGMLNSFTPIFTLIIGGLIFKQKLTSNQFIGVFIAFIGIILLMLAGKSFSNSGSWTHIFAIVLATVMYGISLNTIKHTLQGLKSLEITSLSFGILLIPSLIANFNSGTLKTIQSNPHAYEGLFYISILSIVGTALALILFNRIISLSSTLFASIVTYLIPIVAVIIGFWFKEKINIYQILSMLVVIVGVLIANSKIKKNLIEEK